MNNFFPSEMPDPSQNMLRSGISTPPEEDFNTQAMNGSMQQILSDNLGNYVVCEFIIGTSGLVRREGILYFVGRSYVTLYEEVSMTYIVCDIFSIKFITFYQPGRRPRNRVPASQVRQQNNG